LRHELANYQKDKMSLQNAKSRLHVLETQLRDLTWEHEVLMAPHLSPDPDPVLA
jgi:phage terminase Nu1 subunit (DNA packaging protein)